MKGFESIDQAQLDHSPERLNAACIKAALAFVHFGVVAGATTLASLEKLLTLGPVVTKPEFEVLCRTLHTNPRDIPLAASRWYT